METAAELAKVMVTHPRTSVTILDDIVKEVQASLPVPPEGKPVLHGIKKIFEICYERDASGAEVMMCYGAEDRQVEPPTVRTFHTATPRASHPAPTAAQPSPVVAQPTPAPVPMSAPACTPAHTRTPAPPLPPVSQPRAQPVVAKTTRSGRQPKAPSHLSAYDVSGT